MPARYQEQDDSQEKTVLRGDLTSLRNFPSGQWSLVVWTTMMPFTLSNVFEICKILILESLIKMGLSYS